MANLIVDDEIDFTLYERETEAKQAVKPASFYVQQLIDQIRSPQRPRCHYMPWSTARNKLQFRPGEVTVWGGPNGSGKSLITGQVALSLCAQGQKVCIASFEMKPVKTLERMGRQWTKTNPSDPLVLSDSHERELMLDLFEQFRGWTDKLLWVYDKQGTVDWHRVCAVIRYGKKELGITQFFVDNLMKCVMGEDDYNGQKAFVDELTAIARDHDVHVHLVHHIKKPANEYDKPNKYDFKGSGSITDQVDNVVAVWRNKRKERDAQANKKTSEGEPDTMLIVDKQRNGEGWEGVIALWYNHQTQQFLAGPTSKPMDFWASQETFA
jgi:twinkle protein